MTKSQPKLGAVIYCANTDRIQDDDFDVRLNGKSIGRLVTSDNLCDGTIWKTHADLPDPELSAECLAECKRSELNYDLFVRGDNLFEFIIAQVNSTNANFGEVRIMKYAWNGTEWVLASTHYSDGYAGPSGGDISFNFNW